MRTSREVLRKVKQWETSPMMVSGLYRLLTYIPWEEVPEKYKEFFSKEAQEVWNNDLNDFGKEHIELDLQAETKSILKVLSRKNIVNSLGLVPIFLADMFMYGFGISRYEGTLAKIIEDFQEHIGIDRALAEQYAFVSTIDLFKDMVNKINLKLNFDIEVIAEKMAKEYEEEVEKSAALAVMADKRGQAKSDLDAIVDEALEKEKLGVEEDNAKIQSVNDTNK